MVKNKGNIAVIVLLVGVLMGGGIGYYFYTSRSQISTNVALTKTVAKKEASPASSAVSLESVPGYRPLVLDGINKKRVELGGKKLGVDENLCALAKLLAEEKAVNYPKEVKQDILFDSKYKNYIKDYSSFQSQKISTMDMFIKAVKEKGQTVAAFSDEFLIDSYTDASGSDAIPLTAGLTNGCVAVSPENVGFKQFAVFVGGVKK